MKRLLNIFIDYFVIITQISFGVSIVPYILYDRVTPFSLSLGINAALVFLLMLVRFGGKFLTSIAIKMSTEMLIVFILLFLQLISGLVREDISGFYISIILTCNFYIFYRYINYLFIYNLKRTNNNFYIAFFNTTEPYIYFAFFNVLSVIIVSILIPLGIISPFSNNIDHLFINLLGNNVSTGTQYFMPGWLSIQTFDPRLGIEFLGTLSGWTHEPHVFAYLVFPSLFFWLAKIKKMQWRVSLVVVYSVSGLISFSTTAFLTILLILLIILVFNKKQAILALILILFFMLSNIELDIIKGITDYSVNKLTENTSSLDYSANKINDILIPKTLFGNGVLLIGSSNDKNAGFFSSIFYILFYITIFVNIFKKILVDRKYFQNNFVLYIGLAILYFFIHGFKLSSSVFAMPYTILFIALLNIYNDYKHPKYPETLI